MIFKVASFTEETPLPIDSANLAVLPEPEK